MSKCSCEGSCGCNVGPKIEINNLNNGEQVVTTVKRENIPPPPPKPKDPSIVWFILAVYLSMIVIAALRNGSAPIDPPPYPLPPPIPRPHPCQNLQEPFC
jgi:hypothetical protein